MKASTFIATLLAAVPAFANLPNGLPDGAHNPRNENVARPNVCDDKCDVAFMKVYNACLGGNSGEDCVDKSRLITCQGDFNCSFSCGFTHTGCVNPVTKRELKSSTSCTGESTSTSTVFVTITRPSLDPSLLAPSVSSVTAGLKAQETTDQDVTTVTIVVTTSCQSNTTTPALSSVSSRTGLGTGEPIVTGIPISSLPGLASRMSHAYENVTFTVWRTGTTTPVLSSTSRRTGLATGEPIVTGIPISSIPELASRMSHAYQNITFTVWLDTTSESTGAAIGSKTASPLITSVDATGVYMSPVIGTIEKRLENNVFDVVSTVLSAGIVSTVSPPTGSVILLTSTSNFGVATATVATTKTADSSVSIGNSTVVASGSNKSTTTSTVEATHTVTSISGTNSISGTTSEGTTTMSTSEGTKTTTAAVSTSSKTGSATTLMPTFGALGLVALVMAIFF